MAPVLQSRETSTTSAVSSTASPTPSQATDSQTGNGKTASIVGIVLFSVVASIVVLCLVLYFWNRHKQRSKLPAEHRRRSYVPWRTEDSAHLSLTAHAVSPATDDKSSMFSRDRSDSRLTVYIPDPNQDPSTKRLSLIPVHVSPPSPTANGGFRSPSQATQNSKNSSDEDGEDADISVRRGRPRSTSSISSRYYEPTTPQEQEQQSLVVGVAQ